MRQTTPVALALLIVLSGFAAFPLQTAATHDAGGVTLKAYDLNYVELPFDHGAGNEAKIYGTGAIVIFNVTDNDEQGEGVTIEVTSDFEDTADEITLTEVAKDSKEFSRSFGIALNSDTNGDGRIGVTPDDDGEEDIVVRYTDTDNDQHRFNITWVETHDGTVSITGVAGATLYGSGPSVTITVEDADLNQDTSTIETVTVRVTTPQDPQGFNVTLAETDADDSTFRDSSLVLDGQNKLLTDGGLNSLAMDYGESFTVEYYDEQNAGGHKQVRTDNAQWKRSEDARVALLDLDRNDIINRTSPCCAGNGQYTGVGSDIATAWVYDPDNAGAGSVEITAKAEHAGGLGISVTLDEVGSNTGEFVGTFGFSQSGNSDANDLLRVTSDGSPENDIIHILYEDDLDGTDGSDQDIGSTPAGTQGGNPTGYASVSWSVGHDASIRFTDGNGNTETSFECSGAQPPLDCGDGVHILVEDEDQDGNTVTVRLTSDQDPIGFEMNVDVGTETPIGIGDNSTNNPSTGSSWIWAEDDDNIQVTYLDAETDGVQRFVNVSTSAKITYPSGWPSHPHGSGTITFLESDGETEATTLFGVDQAEPYILQVTDSKFNTNTNTKDDMCVYIGARDHRQTATLTDLQWEEDVAGVLVSMEETGQDTGEFTGEFVLIDEAEPEIPTDPAELRVPSGSYQGLSIDIHAGYTYKGSEPGTCVHDLSDDDDDGGAITASIPWKHTSTADLDFIEDTGSMEMIAGDSVVHGERTLWLRVIDGDRFSDKTDGTDSIDVTVASNTDSGGVTVTLTEQLGHHNATIHNGITSDDRGFIGSIGLRESSTPDGSGETLSVQDGDGIEVRFDDPRTKTGSASEASSDVITWNRSYDGSVSFDEEIYRGDSTDAVITVDDLDIVHESAGAPDELDVVAKSIAPDGSVRDVVTFDSTHASLDQDERVYEVTIDFETSESSNTNLFVKDGDAVRVELVDQHAEDGSTNVVRSAEAHWYADDNSAHVAFDEEEYFTASATATLRLDKPALDQDSDEKEKLNVTVYSDTDGQGVVVELEETQDDSGVFTGSVDFSVTDVASKVHVTDGDTLTMHYFDTGNLTNNPGDKSDDIGRLAHAVWRSQADQPPTATLTATPTSGTVPFNVTFSLEGSDPEGKPLVSWSLDFGDGDSTSGTDDLSAFDSPLTVKHEYDSAGSYTAKLQVTDQQGKPSSETADSKATIEASSPDTTPPNAPSALTAVTQATTSTSTRLTWTAPGDDGSSGGTITSYVIKQASTAFQSEGDWDNGTTIPASRLTYQPSAAPGNTQTVDISGLSPATKYYFAVKAVDDVGLESSFATTSVTTTSVTTTTTTTNGGTTTTTTTSATVSPGNIYLANQKVEVSVERQGESNVVSWVLPDDPPLPVQGVQLWRSNSPYTLLTDVEDTNTSTFQDDSAGALETSRYAVTMYYGKTSELGYFTGEGDDAIDTSQYQGAAPGETVGGEGDDGIPTWVWYVVGGIVLLAIIAITLVVVLRRRGDDEEAESEGFEGYTWDAEAEEGSGATAWPEEESGWTEEEDSETHQMQCPACDEVFQVSGTRPIITNCPGCGKKGVLR